MGKQKEKIEGIKKRIPADSTPKESDSKHSQKNNVSENKGYNEVQQDDVPADSKNQKTKK